MIIKIVLFLSFLILSILFLLYKFYNNSDNVHKVYGKIAKSDTEKIKGLMYRKIPLKYDEGMLFPMEYKNNSMGIFVFKPTHPSYLLVSGKTSLRLSIISEPVPGLAFISRIIVTDIL